MGASDRTGLAQVAVTLAAAIVLGGCGQADSSGNQRSTDMARKTPALEEFARSYLAKHVCPDAPTPETLAHHIAQAIRDRPGTTWRAAAQGICNKTRR